MSDKPVKKKGGGIMKLLMMVVGAVVLIGAGGAGGIYAAQSGMIGGGAPAAKAKGHGEAAEHSEEGSARYYAIEQGFTSNLRDSDSFVQASVAVSMHGDEKVTDVIKTNEPALRSVILQTLADQDYPTMSSMPGRQELRKKLRDVLNAELKSVTGSGGIDNVYFTAFVLQ